MPNADIIGIPIYVYFSVILFFFFNETAPTEISPLPLHDPLPISAVARATSAPRRRAPGRHQAALRGRLARGCGGPGEVVRRARGGAGAGRALRARRTRRAGQIGRAHV